MCAPDGRTLFFRGPSRMMAATIADRPTLSVVRRDSLFVDIYDRYSWQQSYDVMPNGREFLVTKGPTRADAHIYAIVNWQELLKRQGAANTN